MAQLKDTTIDGRLTIDGTTYIPSGYPIYGRSANGDAYNMLELTSNNRTLVGYGGWKKGDAITEICGKDVLITAGSAQSSFYPYRKAGDSVDVAIKTAGYVTDSGRTVSFLVPLSMPTIGTPAINVSSIDGFILRQGGKYTHGSDSGVYVKPVSYSTTVNWTVGIYVTAEFDVTTNVTSGDAIGVYWSGNITFS